MPKRYDLKHSDTVYLNLEDHSVELIVIKYEATDTVEFALESPAEEEVVFQKGDDWYPVQWDEGVPYVELPTPEPKPDDPRGVPYPWECRVCETKTMWSYFDCANSGTPVCPDCGDDMTMVE